MNLKVRYKKALGLNPAGRPSKALGQNFLRDQNLARKIAEAGDIQAGDLVLEIGPGEGILTAQILARGARVVAVEKDERLCKLLAEKFANQIQSGSLVLVHDDILKLDPLPTSPLAGGGVPYKLIANIPYYITGAILRKFLTAKHQPECMVLMLQKEVAERIVARDGRESILSISVKVFGNPKILFRVRRGAFRPAPNVDSAVLVIENISRERFHLPPTPSQREGETFLPFGRRNKEGVEENFFKILRAGFAHPRKKLSSNLKPLFGNKPPPGLPFIKGEEQGGGLNARAENLTVQQWLKLAEML